MPFSHPRRNAMPDEIAAAGREVVDLLGACAAAPDDLETGRAADDALLRLDRLLAAGASPAGDALNEALTTLNVPNEAFRASSSPSPKGTSQ
jgi:hypothetical protein